MSSTETEISKALGILSASYPNHPLTTETVAVYQRLLADLPSQALEGAVLGHVATSKWFPAVSEIREAAHRLLAGNNATMSSFEAWEIVQREMRRVGHWGTPEFGDELVGRAVKCIGWKHLCSTEQLGFERTNFLKVYENFRERDGAERKMLPEVRALLGGGGGP